jgi:hypothetical protein
MKSELSKSLWAVDVPSRATDPDGETNPIPAPEDPSKEVPNRVAPPKKKPERENVPEEAPLRRAA